MERQWWFRWFRWWWGSGLVGSPQHYIHTYIHTYILMDMTKHIPFVMMLWVVNSLREHLTFRHNTLLHTNTSSTPTGSYSLLLLLLLLLGHNTVPSSVPKPSLKLVPKGRIRGHNHNVTILEILAPLQQSQELLNETQWHRDNNKRPAIQPWFSSFATYSAQYKSKEAV